MDAVFLSEQELIRYKNQLLLTEIGTQGQLKLKNALVAVIGAGSLGIPILQCLSASGVGKIGIIDFDVINDTNIQQQTIYGPNDFGKLKTIVAKSHLEKIFNATTFEIVNLQLNRSNGENILRSYDLIIDATNLPNVHDLVDNISEKLGKTFIVGSVFGMNAIFSVFNHFLGFSFKNSQQMFQLSAPVITGQYAGNSIVVYGTTGSLMALEALRVLVHSPNSLLGSVFQLDLINYNFSKIKLKIFFEGNLSE